MRKTRFSLSVDAFIRDKDKCILQNEINIANRKIHNLKKFDHHNFQQLYINGLKLSSKTKIRQNDAKDGKEVDKYLMSPIA